MTDETSIEKPQGKPSREQMKQTLPNSHDKKLTTKVLNDIP